ncbi:MAG: hypothetical protein FD138_961, partial [Planctomycetota bacterium]
MSIVHFQCPSCQAPLRLENRALFVGRSFDCPDCRETLLIEAEGSTGVKALPMPASASTKNPSLGSTPLARRTVDKTNSHMVTDLGVSLQARQSIWNRLSRQPAMLGWIVAALFAVILFVAISPGHQPTSSESDPTTIEPATSETTSSKETLPAESPAQSKLVVEDAPALNVVNELNADANPVLPIPPLPAGPTSAPPRDDKPNPVAVRADDKPPVEPPKP